MSGESGRWRRLSAVFAAALERGPDERPGYLAEACGGDAGLRGEVESLLAAHERAGEFLEPPAAGFPSEIPTADLGGPAEGRALLAAGARLGPYEIVALLGAGGMGEVYRAHDPRLGREVAIKVLLRAAPAAADLQRFSQEARTAGALNHPNLLAVYDVGAEAGRPFVVTELLRGETLRERLRQGPLPLAQAIDAARQVLAGLEAAHEKGIVHRDLKPENLFLTADGRVKVLDFGLAKQGTGGDESFPTLTRTGLVLGTVGYTAPEQLRGRPADARSDLFAFGAVLYEMLAGRRAFTGGSAVAAMSATLLDEPPPLAAERPEVPAGLERLVRRCLAKAPEERFGSAREVRWALEALAAPSSAARRVTEGAAAVPAERSIAVLPFVNMSPDPGQEYFCEGLAEELIHALGQLAELRVAGRSSSFFFKGRPDAVRRIGEELRVESVLEGSVRRAGERLRITVQLVNAADGYHLWSDRYDLAMEDVFAVQDEITARVVEALRLRLADPRQARRRATPDLEAYHLYLRGRYHWNKRHEGALLAGVREFEQAIEKDPLYAPAWAGLADSYALLASYALARPADAMPRAKAAALKALEIDDRLPDPHAALGWVAMHYDWDWQGAESHFRRAIELGPGRATTRHWYSFLLSALARSEEALLQAQKGAELDPLSLIVLVSLAQPLYFARRYAEVVAQAGRVVEMDPSFPVGHLWLGLGYAGSGRYAEAAAEQEAFASSFGRSPRGLGFLGHAKALAGEREEATALLAELVRRAEAGEAAAYYAAVVALGLGEADAAIGWLERAMEERADQLPYLAVEPLLDPLRGDPRFAALLRRLRLETAARLATPAPPPAPSGPAAESPPARGRAVAVLPFRDLGAEAGAEGPAGQLGLALADATITELAHLKALLVRPTSTILGYRWGDVDPQQAGRELAVDAVVDGTLQRAGERLRVSVRLVGTADGGCLWGETMEVGLDDLFRVQDEVSRQIARALAVELGAGEERRRARRTQLGKEAGRAYELYLRGKTHLFRESLADFVAAIDWFERARDADPEFAPAWAGLADAYSRIAFTYQPEGDWYARAEGMCEKALSLDPQLPEGLYVRARLRWSPQGRWDHAGVIRDLWAAGVARPNLEEAFVRLGVVLYHVGLAEEGMAQLDHALVISPQHALARCHQGFCRYQQGRFAEALEITESVSSLDPASWVQYQTALCKIRMGDLEAAAVQAARLSRGYPLLALVAALRGDAAEADRQIRLTEENRKAFGDFHHAQYEVATTYAQLGRLAPAIEWLTAAARNGYPCTVLYESDPLLLPLRDEPAFARLLAELRAGTAAYAALWAELQARGSAVPSAA